MGEPLHIQVVSDIVCPWCFIGYRRLAAALERLPGVDALVDWLPYSLNPYVPREGVGFQEHYERKFGEHHEALLARVTEAGRSAGIDFRFDRIQRVPNTISAHTVIHWAARGEQRSRLVERFFRGYFLEGRDMSDDSVLASLAADVGLARDEVAARLSQQRDREEVAAAADANRRSGITGVPFFVIDSRYVIEGAQRPDTIVQVIQKARELPAGAR